jgi:hypothetical protein
MEQPPLSSACTVPLCGWTAIFLSIFVGNHPISLSGSMKEMSILATVCIQYKVSLDCTRPSGKSHSTASQKQIMGERSVLLSWKWRDWTQSVAEWNPQMVSFVSSGIRFGVAEWNPQIWLVLLVQAFVLKATHWPNYQHTEQVLVKGMMEQWFKVTSDGPTIQH